MAKEAGLNYKLTDSVNEQQKKPVYCVSFNTIDPAHSRLVASCGGRRVTIYECQDDGRLEVLQGYLDQDDNEEFYAVKWSVLEDTGAPLLLAGGNLGIVRVLDCHSQSLVWSAVGHGLAINDIAIHPEHPDLFLTASKDLSLRLWNMTTQVCVLLVSGEGGHTNEVVSIDFNAFDPDCFVSSGLDDTVKIWTLQGHKDTIEASYKHPKNAAGSFKTGHLSIPTFSSRKVHWNYVDCVRWMGDLILSKSVDNRVLMWQPVNDKENTAQNAKNGMMASKGHVHLLQEYQIEDADIWFIRFSLDCRYKILACGNRMGKVYVYDLTADASAGRRARRTLKVSSKEKCTVRQTAVSEDGSIILACCDDGTIHRFDRVTEERQPEPEKHLTD